MYKTVFKTKCPIDNLFNICIIEKVIKEDKATLGSDLRA